MRFLLAWLLAAGAITMVLYNIVTVYRHWKRGYGKSCLPVVATLLGAPAVALFMDNPNLGFAILIAGIIDFGSWILTAYICKWLGYGNR